MHRMPHEPPSTSSDSPHAPEPRLLAREALVRAHMEDENQLDFEAVLRTFPHPRYEIIPTGAVYEGARAGQRLLP